MNNDCAYIRELIDSHICGELTVESSHEVLRHLERCHTCRAEYARRERLRQLLVESLSTSVNATALESRITRALDREQYRGRRQARYGGIAAALVLLASVSVWFSQPVDGAAFDDSVDDHIVCALTRPPSLTYDADRAAKALGPAYESIADTFAHRVGDYELIDAHMCPYRGRTYVHLVYRDDDRVLSVFNEAATRGRLPMTHETLRKGFVTVGASRGGRHAFIVSDSIPRAPAGVIDDLLRASLKFSKLP